VDAKAGLGSGIQVSNVLVTFTDVRIIITLAQCIVYYLL